FYPLFFFFFNDTATTEIYTLSLHDALPISPRFAALRSEARREAHRRDRGVSEACGGPETTADGRGDARRRGPLHAHARRARRDRDRKSTRLNSSHVAISYAVFCLKKKKKKE